MKKLYITLLFCILTQALVAQQYTSYTQYTLNRFETNPAVAGLRPCAVLTTGRRTQWIGFEGAPTITFVNFNTRINRQQKYPKSFHGVGGSFRNERFGFNENISLNAAYAYHLKLNKNYHLSFGAQVGAQQYKINYGAIRIQNLGLDPVFDNQEAQTRFYPEISLGSFLYHKNAYVGLSLLQIYPIETGRFGTSENKLTPHFFLTSGYRFRGRKIDIIPSVMSNFSGLISPTVDFTLTFDYKQKIALALGSKYLNSTYATLQIGLGQFVSVGYTYEYALTEIAKVAPRTQEIVLQIKTCKFKEETFKNLCPAYQ